jgi:tRNA-binding EMAP/Myf-like protein
MSELINWNDFEKIQIKAGTIIDVADFPNARKPAYQLTIDSLHKRRTHRQADCCGCQFSCKTNCQLLQRMPGIRCV